MKTLKIVIAIAIVLLLAGCITQKEQPPASSDQGTSTDTKVTTANESASSTPPLPPEAESAQNPKYANNGPPLPPE